MDSIAWPCARCGSGFERLPDSRGQQASWCKPCQVEYRAAYKKVRRERGDWAKPNKSVCIDCHERCSGKRCMACHRIAHPATPKPASIGKPRSLAKRNPRNDQRYKSLRVAVLAEESHCGICGEPVDKTLRAPHKMSPTIDHIVPTSLGGEWFDRSNVRLAHWSCNSREGNKARENAAIERVALARAALWLADRLVA